MPDDLDVIFRYLPPDWKPFYVGQPWWDWLEMTYHISQSCAFDLHHLCAPGYRYVCPRMPTGLCECVCHSNGRKSP